MHTQINNPNVDTYIKALSRDEDEALVDKAIDLTEVATLRGILPIPFNTIQTKNGVLIGSALKHEIYDVSPDGSQALLCCRKVEAAKLGFKTTSRDYYILAKAGRDVVARKLDLAALAQVSMAAEELGEVIQRLKQH